MWKVCSWGILSNEESCHARGPGLALRREVDMEFNFSDRLMLFVEGPSVPPQPNSVMDPQLWGSLPDELMMKVFARLPLSDVVRLQVMSGNWRSLLSSHKFFRLRIEAPPCVSCFFMFGFKKTCTWPGPNIYNFVSSKWYRLTLRLDTHVPTENVVPDTIYPIASAGGLICCSVLRGQDLLFADLQCLLVYNPLTRRSRQLPEMPDEPTCYPMVTMVFDDRSDTYKVIVAGTTIITYGPFDDHLRTTKVYDSATGCWKVTGKVPEHTCLNSGSTVYCNGLLYCLSCRDNDVDLLTYSFGEEIWRKLPINFPNQWYQSGLMEHQGRVFIVGASHNGVDPESFWVWELQEKDMVWRDIGTLHPRLCRDEYKVLQRGIGSHYRAVKQGDWICFYIFDDISWPPKLLIYDFRQKNWHWLPSCPFDADFHVKDFSLLLPFEPRVDSMV